MFDVNDIYKFQVISIKNWQDKMTVSYEASRKSKKLDSYFEEKESD